MKPIVYRARRVPYDSDGTEILDESWFFKEIELAIKDYGARNIDMGSYYLGGAWFFPKISEKSVKSLSQKQSPLTPEEIWTVLREKIRKSDVLVAEVCPKAYGTIMEAAYAGGLGNIPVYAFPKKGLTQEEIEDLWFIFNLSLSTRKLWNPEHFSKSFGLMEDFESMEHFEQYLKSIVPNFMKSLYKD